MGVFRSKVKRSDWFYKCAYLWAKFKRQKWTLAHRAAFCTQVNEKSIMTTVEIEFFYWDILMRSERYNNAFTHHDGLRGIKRQIPPCQNITEVHFNQTNKHYKTPSKDYAQNITKWKHNFERQRKHAQTFPNLFVLDSILLATTSFHDELSPGGADALESFEGKELFFCKVKYYMIRWSRKATETQSNLFVTLAVLSD